MKKLLIAAAVAVFATGAQAADMAARVYTKAPMITAPSWTGFYAGVNIGYGWDDPTVTFTPTEFVGAALINSSGSRSPVNPPTSFNVKGVAGGVQFGYNYQFDQRWLAGLETDFNGSDIKGGASTPIVLGPGIFNRPGSANANEEVQWFGTVRGRLGYLATPGLLVFGSGGLAYGKVNHSAAIFNGGTAFGIANLACQSNANCYAGSSSRIATGWTAGGGVEYAVIRNWTLKAEYLYVNLGSDSFGINPLAFTAPNPGTINASYTDTHFNLVRLGANYRF